jgi:hypothetical protein
MSFKCQSCNKQQKAGVKPVKVVSQKRAMYYPEVRDRDNEVIARRGKGWEIAEELDCCTKCAPRIEENCTFVKKN